MIYEVYFVFPWNGIYESVGYISIITNINYGFDYCYITCGNVIIDQVKNEFSSTKFQSDRNLESCNLNSVMYENLDHWKIMNNLLIPSSSESNEELKDPIHIDVDYSDPLQRMITLFFMIY